MVCCGPTPRRDAPMQALAAAFAVSAAVVRLLVLCSSSTVCASVTSAPSRARVGRAACHEIHCRTSASHSGIICRPKDRRGLATTHAAQNDGARAGAEGETTSVPGVHCVTRRFAYRIFIALFVAAVLLSDLAAGVWLAPSAT